MECRGLTSVVILGGKTNIGNCAFAWCNSLTSIVIPENATKISAALFWACSNLTSVVIPESVTSIENEVFYDCSRLTSIQFTGTTEQWNAIPKGYNWNAYTGNYTVSCIDGTVSKGGVVTLK